MTLVTTDLGVTRESARRERFEPVPGNTATNVQQAIQNAQLGFVIPTAREPSFSSTVTINTSDIEVAINTSTGPVLCLLPSVTGWSAAQQNGLELTVFDFTGNAAAHNITLQLSVGDAVVQGVLPAITSNFGMVKLRPMAVGKWYVRGIN